MDEKVRDFLNDLDDATEGASISEYSVWLGPNEITVRVYDRGSDRGINRYTAEADWAIPDAEVQARGGTTRHVGNPDGTLEGALANVQWGRFRPPAD